jgi:hypothetical protein
MIALIAAGVVCLVFARAIIHKLTAFGEFRAAVFDYRVAPEQAVAAVSIGLIAAEIAALWLIAVPGLRPIGAMLAATLLAIYAGVIALNILRGRSRIDCGCGGAGQALSWWLVMRNALLIGACMLIVMGGGSRAWDSGGAIAMSGSSAQALNAAGNTPALIGESHGLTGAEILAAAGCAIVLWLLLVLLDQLLANRSHVLATSTTHSH